jgi:hypothetical protein
MQTSSSARKSTDKTPMTPERRDRARDGREVRDMDLAGTSRDVSTVDMHGYDELPFTD